MKEVCRTVNLKLQRDDMSLCEILQAIYYTIDGKSYFSTLSPIHVGDVLINACEDKLKVINVIKTDILPPRGIYAYIACYIKNYDAKKNLSFSEMIAKKLLDGLIEARTELDKVGENGTCKKIGLETVIKFKPTRNGEHISRNTLEGSLLNIGEDGYAEMTMRNFLYAIREYTMDKAIPEFEENSIFVDEKDIEDC